MFYLCVIRKRVFSFFERGYLYVLGAFSLPLLRHVVLNTRGVYGQEVVKNRLMYVAASCMPFHITGYTTRTHAIINAMGFSGINVTAVTRPGYPWDRKDRLLDAEGEVAVVEDVRYQLTAIPSHHRPVVLYAFQASRPVAEHAKKHKVAVIHAASNHVNALPALLAARRLGLRFHYEMRGIWELTRISRFPEFEKTRAYRHALALESFVAKSADRLYVISEQLGRFVVDNWGVDPVRIALLPNCVDPALFDLAEPGVVEANTIGYAGSLIDYEGLDVLIRALGLLRDQGVLLQLRVVGEGEVRAQLENLTRELDLAAQVQFLGRRSPEQARNVILKSAIVCLPRKPFEVCKIVTPIKLVEALAMGKPVIVPDLPVFKDELRMKSDETPGWFFKAGNAADLACVLKLAFADAGVMREKSALARSHAVTMRNWQQYVQDIYDHLPVEVA